MEHKSEEMAVLAQKHGWRTQVRTDMKWFEESGNVDDILWILYAMRIDDKNRMETLRVKWKGDLQDSALYKYGEYTLQPARKAPVLALITGKPNPNKFSKEKPEELTIEERLLGKNVPWESDNSPAFDILIGVLGRTITWASPSLRIEKTESCPKSLNLSKGHFRVKTTKTGKRVLEWVNSFGFHACYVSNIIDVS